MKILNKLKRVRVKFREFLSKGKNFKWTVPVENNAEKRGKNKNNNEKMGKGRNVINHQKFLENKEFKKFFKLV